VSDEQNNAATSEEEGLVFEDDAPKVVPVTIKSRDGTVNKYELREMTGAGLSKWLQISSTRVKRNRRGEPVGNVDFSAFHASLISLCLFDPQTGTTVPKSVIDGWPAGLQGKLFAECRKMNGLDDDEDKAKND
jgi:hypothetical protein